VGHSAQLFIIRIIASLFSYLRVKPDSGLGLFFFYHLLPSRPFFDIPDWNIKALNSSFTFSW
jgi:hypothetical protein